MFATASIASPKFLTFHNGDLFVTSASNDKVTQFDGSTGAQITSFIPGGDVKPDSPEGLVWGSNGNLYVSSENDDKVLEYDITGAFVKEFVTAGSGGLNEPADLTFGPNGNLFVASEKSDEILEYQGFGPVAFIPSSPAFSCADTIWTPYSPMHCLTVDSIGNF